eukprot:TRINITY_DN11239_c0_g1_i1.p1 TRINITY_DN11239_c0_g1~~TRINITY_DN11239_c0_g1_i1.p1  ORF type:complete len:403 (+),score=80.14 TRINITY_DN11239_c0_g1_i1:82-1209(+)
MVRIRDRRLGLLHYISLFLIISYVFGWTIMYEKRYLLMDQPLGSLRLSLQKPVNPRALAQLDYCSQTQPNINGISNNPCQYWDQNLVMFPSTEQQAIFVTTRTTLTNMTLECSWSEPNCTYTQAGPATIYVADIERFTLMIDHAFTAPVMGLQKNANSLIGQLLDSEGNEMVLNGTNVVGKQGYNDIMEIDILLEAAGITSLNLPFDNTNSSTMRSTGIIILVNIDYTNMRTYRTRYVEYIMTATQILNTEFKELESISREYPNSLIQLNRHGIQILITQTGNLGQFDFPTLLLSLVSGLGLTAATTILVDLIAVMVMPHKDIYSKYKYDETIDFSDLRDGTVAPEADPTISYKFKTLQRESPCDEEAGEVIQVE